MLESNDKLFMQLKKNKLNVNCKINLKLLCALAFSYDTYDAHKMCAS